MRRMLDINEIEKMLPKSGKYLDISIDPNIGNYLTDVTNNVKFYEDDHSLTICGAVSGKLTATAISINAVQLFTFSTDNTYLNMLIPLTTLVGEDGKAGFTMYECGENITITCYTDLTGLSEGDTIMLFLNAVLLKDGE